jgi:TusA-related sulfurtransferase
VPPGAEQMQRMKSEITYQFQNLAQGGIVTITTTNKTAISAIHRFLQFQIREHQTGDPLQVQK